MYGTLGWVIADDCIGDDGYYDEDEAIVNSRDTLRDSHDIWADELRICGGVDEFEEDLDHDDPLRGEFERYSDDTHYTARQKAITMAGVISSSCSMNDFDYYDDGKLEEDAIEYISIQEHLDDDNPTGEDNGIPGVEKQEPRPFEKWIKDVKAGRKSISDPL